MIQLKKMKIQGLSNSKTSPKLTELVLATWKKILETKMQYHYFQWVGTLYEELGKFTTLNQKDSEHLDSNSEKFGEYLTNICGILGLHMDRLIHY